MAFGNLMSNARRLSKRINIVLLLLTLIGACLVFFTSVQLERIRMERTLLLAAAQIEAELSRSLETRSALLGNDLAQANHQLQPIVNAVAGSYPEMGLGVYSREADCVVAIYPFDKSLLKPVSKDYPYFASYVSGIPEFSVSASSLGWNGKSTINVTVPIFASGRIIGHTWANIKTELLLAGSVRMLLLIVPFWLIAYLVVRRLIWGIFGAIGRDIAQFAHAVDQDEEQMESEVLADLAPLLQLVQHQKRALRQESEHKEVAKRELETLFNISRDYICIVKDGHFLKVNPAFCEALGYSEQELIGKEYIACMHPACHAEALLQRQSLLNGKTLALENRYVCADGSVRTISWVAVGHRGITYAIGRDVTEQRELDDRMAKLDRLNLAGEMAASISHEIRNPLTTVRGFIQLAQIRGEKPVPDEHYRTMIEELDRANAIITEYLALSKDKVYTREKGCLNKLLDGLLPLVQAEALMRGHLLVMELSDIPSIFIDANEIRQLVLNLVKNGLDAMQTPGVLAISTSSQAGSVSLEVVDQGPGIPEEVLKRIPTPFFTTKEQGTGLGLAVCYRIAEHHEAEIRIDTGRNGTTFKVLFPL